MDNALGFAWNSALVPNMADGDMARALFTVQKLMPEVVFDTAALEDNPMTFVEVKTLLEGVTIGGHKVSDERQVLNQAESWQELLRRVKAGTFALDKDVFCALNNLVAREESLAWGAFRNGKVSIAGTAHMPPDFTELDDLFVRGLNFIKSLPTPMERGICFYLFGALHQFFFDGNKRTARLMMNGELLRHGLDAVLIPVARKQEFNAAMLDFYDTLTCGKIVPFLLSCQGGRHAGN